MNTKDGYLHLPMPAIDRTPTGPIVRSLPVADRVPCDLDAAKATVSSDPPKTEVEWRHRIFNDLQVLKKGQGKVEDLILNLLASEEVGPSSRIETRPRCDSSPRSIQSPVSLDQGTGTHTSEGRMRSRWRKMSDASLDQQRNGARAIRSRLMARHAAPDETEEVKIFVRSTDGEQMQDADIKEFKPKLQRSGEGMDQEQKLEVDGDRDVGGDLQSCTSSNYFNGRGPVEPDPEKLLYDGWPQNIEVRHGLPNLGEKEHTLRASTPATMTRIVSQQQPKGTVSASLNWANISGFSLGSGALLEQGRCSCLVLRVSGVRRLLIDLCRCGILFYELLVYPYVLAWRLELRDLAWVRAANFICSILWLLDVFLNFFSSFIEDGEVVKDLMVIVRHYLQGRFGVDFALLLAGWIGFIFEYDNAKSSSVGNIGRVARSLSLIRAVRLHAVFDQMVDRCYAESHRLALLLSALVLSVIITTHVFCCVWVSIGKERSSDTGSHWLAFAREESLDELSPAYVYAISYHWAMAQITLGASDIYPTNTAERAFNILCLIFGLMLSCTLVSTFSSIMFEFVMHSQENKRKMRKLRYFLRDNAVVRDIAIRVQRQVRCRLLSHKKVMMHDVPALAMLSKSLRADLHYTIFLPHLVKHPLFNLWQATDAGAHLKALTDELDTRLLMPEDELFVACQAANATYCILQGSMMYRQEPQTSLVQKVEETQVQENRLLCEVALWTDWAHVGVAEALTNCQVLSINVATVFEILEGKSTTAQLSRAYGLAFHRAVINCRPPHAKWPNDVRVDFADVADLALAMEQKAQSIVGEASLYLWRSKQGWSRAIDRQDKKIFDEVHSGSALVVINTQGDLERLVSVAAIRMYLQESPDFILVQIAKVEDGGVLVPDCKLPGGKQARGELPEEATQRYILTKLPHLLDHLILERMDREVVGTWSKTASLYTKYIRNISNCRLVAQGVSLRAKKWIEDTSLTNRDVFMHGGGLFAFLTQDEFEELRDAANTSCEVSLEQWLSTLQSSWEEAGSLTDYFPTFDKIIKAPENSLPLMWSASTQLRKSDSLAAGSSSASHRSEDFHMKDSGQIIDTLPPEEAPLQPHRSLDAPMDSMSPKEKRGAALRVQLNI